LHRRRDPRAQNTSAGSLTWRSVSRSLLSKSRTKPSAASPAAPAPAVAARPTPGAPAAGLRQGSDVCRRPPDRRDIRRRRQRRRRTRERERGRDNSPNHDRTHPVPPCVAHEKNLIRSTRFNKPTPPKSQAAMAISIAPIDPAGAQRTRARPLRRKRSLTTLALEHGPFRRDRSTLWKIVEWRMHLAANRYRGRCRLRVVEGITA
jgi:hypothetical protein